MKCLDRINYFKTKYFNGRVVKWQLLLWLLYQIERLREEGSKLLKEQQEILKAQLRKEMESGQDETKSEETTPKLKVHDKVLCYAMFD